MTTAATAQESGQLTRLAAARDIAHTVTRALSTVASHKLHPEC